MSFATSSGAQVVPKVINAMCSFLTEEAPEALPQASDVLESGRLIVAPTETRYGLLGRADDESTVESLYLAKRRPADLVTAVFLPSVAEISRWARIAPTAVRLQERFLPGPLTIVLPATETAIKMLAPRVIRRGEIGVRVSRASFISRLLKRVSFPLTATSANISGSETAVQIDEIAEEFGKSVALFIDGGELDSAVSTVVRCGADYVEILRKGALSEVELQVALGTEIEVKQND